MRSSVGHHGLLTSKSLVADMKPEKHPDTASRRMRPFKYRAGEGYEPECGLRQDLCGLIFSHQAVIDVEHAS